MLRFLTTVTGALELAAKVDRVERGLGDMAPLWRKVAFDWELQAHAMFQSEGADRGHAWAPLSPAYAKAKRAAGYTGGILERTGKLRQAMQGGPGAVRRIMPRSAEIGTSSPIAPFHQFGTKRMPARPLIQIGPEDERRWTLLGDEYVRELLRGAGL